MVEVKRKRPSYLERSHYRENVLEDIWVVQVRLALDQPPPPPLRAENCQTESLISIIFLPSNLLWLQWYWYNFFIRFYFDIYWCLIDVFTFRMERKKLFHTNLRNVKKRRKIKLIFDITPSKHECGMGCRKALRKLSVCFIIVYAIIHKKNEYYKYNDESWWNWHNHTDVQL